MKMRSLGAQALGTIARGTLSGCVAASLLLAAPALAKSDKECERPRPPAIPDGRTATPVEMVGATQRAKLYMESAETYVGCLDEAQQSVTETARDVKLKRIEKKRSEFVEERDALIEKFNEQVRLYKARTGETEETSTPAPPAPSAPAPPPAGAPR